MSINLPTMVCDPYCFITMGDGQTIGTSTISGVTEAPFTHCGVSPFVCSDHGDTGVNGHDMPDVAAADTGGGAAGNPGGETGNPEGEIPPAVEPGQWMAVNEHMSARAAQYQTQITGRQPGWAYVVDGVKFDGYLDGTLLEAKGPGYDSFLTPNGEFKSWFTGDQSMINEAVRQVGVAGQIPIEWHVAELRSYNAIRQLLAGFDSIQVIHTPFLP